MTEFTYDENEDFVRGRELRGKVLGSEYNERTTQVGAEDDFMGPLRQLSVSSSGARFGRARVSTLRRGA